MARKRQAGRAGFVSREKAAVVTRTGRTAGGARLREEVRNGQLHVWNAFEGRTATQEEVDSATWTTV
jgi:hypothetical protein